MGGIQSIGGARTDFGNIIIGQGGASILRQVVNNYTPTTYTVPVGKVLVLKGIGAENSTSGSGTFGITVGGVSLFAINKTGTGMSWQMTDRDRMFHSQNNVPSLLEGGNDATLSSLGSASGAVASDAPYLALLDQGSVIGLAAAAGNSSAGIFGYLVDRNRVGE